MIIESQSKIKYFGHNLNAIEILISARHSAISIAHAFQ